MTEIRNLTKNAFINDDDIFPLYDEKNKVTRSVIAERIKDYINSAALGLTWNDKVITKIKSLENIVITFDNDEVSFNVDLQELQSAITQLNQHITHLTDELNNIKDLISNQVSWG